jgi:predicted ATP-grasp superfamily ATP-dependent carboligase
MQKTASGKCILLFSGYNQRAIISFCRFANDNNISFYIVAKNNEDPILFSKYKNNVIDIRKNVNILLDDFIKWKNQIIENEIVILPSTEFLNRFILKNRIFLKDNDYIVPLCESSLYEEISDKYTFSKLCKKYDILTPSEYHNNLKYPCVAKPKTYSNISKLILKPVILYSNESYNEFKNNYDLNDFYFQEYIQGKSIYFLFYFSIDGSVSLYSQENLLQQNQGASIIAAISADYHINDISSKYIKMFSEIGFHGLMMIEVKLYNEQYYIIEANPRLWGPSQLILDAGMDLFHRFMIDYKLLQTDNINTIYKKDIIYYWSGGIFSDRKNKLNIVFHGDYNLSKYLQDYYSLFSSEIYLKEDTKEIFLLEHKK